MTPIRRSIASHTSAAISGPPKRFAQSVGAVITTSAAILALGFGLYGAADGLLVVMILAAGLESIFAYCLGCKVFGLLMLDLWLNRYAVR